MVTAANDPYAIIHDLWETLNDAERAQFHAYIMRLANKDPLAYRLSDMVSAGQISFRQMLARMKPHRTVRSEASWG